MVVGFIWSRWLNSSASAPCVSSGSFVVIGFIRVCVLGVIGLIRCCWVHSGASWASSGSMAVVVLIRVFREGRCVHSRSLVPSDAPWGTSDRFGGVGFIQVCPGVVGFIGVCSVHWG